MGNEEIILHFRRIHIIIYVNPAWMGSGMEEMQQMWMRCKPCRPQTYLMYVGGSQGAADRRR